MHRYQPSILILASERSYLQIDGCSGQGDEEVGVFLASSWASSNKAVGRHAETLVEAVGKSGRLGKVK